MALSLFQFHFKKLLTSFSSLLRLSGQIGSIAVCVAEKLSSLRFESRLVGNEDHPSVICHYQAATARETIWLQAHLATAIDGNRFQWKHDLLGRLWTTASIVKEW